MYQLRDLKLLQASEPSTSIKEAPVHSAIDHSSLGSSGLEPFDESSAGLSSRLTNPYSKGDNLLQIIVRRFVSIMWKRFVSLLLHFSTVLESVHFYQLNLSWFVALLVWLAQLYWVNSNLGIVISCMGANLVFPITKPQWILLALKKRK